MTISMTLILLLKICDTRKSLPYVAVNGHGVHAVAGLDDKLKSPAQATAPENLMAGAGGGPGAPAQRRMGWRGKGGHMGGARGGAPRRRGDISSAPTRSLL